MRIRTRCYRYLIEIKSSELHTFRLIKCPKSQVIGHAKKIANEENHAREWEFEVTKL